MKRSLCLAVALFVVKITFAQMREATFEDGTKINYDILETKSDKIKPGILRINIVDPGIEYQYYKYKEFLVDGGITLEKAGVNFTYFFLNTEKDKKQPITVKSKYTGANTVTNYVIKGNTVTLDHNWGAHGGVAYLIPNLINLYGGLSAIQLAAGIGHFKTRHMAWFVEDKSNGNKNKMSFTRRGGFFADVLYFAGITVADKYKTSYPKGISGVSPFGMQIYFEGSSTGSKKKKNEFGLFWRGGWTFGLGGGVRGGWPIFGLGLAF